MINDIISNALLLLEVAFVIPLDQGGCGKGQGQSKTTVDLTKTSDFVKIARGA